MNTIQESSPACLPHKQPPLGSHFICVTGHEDGRIPPPSPRQNTPPNLNLNKSSCQGKPTTMRRGIADGAAGEYPPLSEGEEEGEEFPLLLRIKGTLPSDKMKCTVGSVNCLL